MILFIMEIKFNKKSSNTQKNKYGRLMCEKFLPIVNWN